MGSVEVRSSLLNRTLRGGLRPDLAALPLPENAHSRGFAERIQEPLEQNAFVDCWKSGLSLGETSALTPPWLAASFASVATMGWACYGVFSYLASTPPTLGALPAIVILVGGLAAASSVGAVAGAGAYVATACLTSSILRHRREQAAEAALTAPLPEPARRAAVLRDALDKKNSLAGGLLGMALGPFVTGPAGSAFLHSQLTTGSTNEKLTNAIGFPLICAMGFGLGMASSPVSGYRMGLVEGVRSQIPTAAGVVAGVGLGVGATLLAGGHPAVAGLVGWLGGCLGGSLASAAAAPLTNPDLRQVRRWQAEMNTRTQGQENLIRLATGLDLTETEDTVSNRLLERLSPDERGLLLRSVANEPQLGPTMMEWACARQANPELAGLELWQRALARQELKLDDPHVGEAIRALCHAPEAAALVRDLKNDDRGRLLAHLAGTWVDQATALARIGEIARSYVVGVGELRLQNGRARLVEETETSVRVGGINLRRRLETQAARALNEGSRRPPYQRSLH